MTISFARHRFPPDIIRHAVWLYLRFTLSLRDVEDLLAERGIDVSYETVRRLVLKFGPLFARELRRRRHGPTSQWHLDEMAVLIGGRQFWLWRAVDHRERFSTCWCHGGATQGRPRSSCANCSGNSALRLRRWSLISCAPMERPRRNWAYRLAMSKACGRTIGPRIHICRPDDASGRCSASNRPDQRNGSCPFRAVLHNTFNVQRHLVSRNTPRALRGEALQSWRVATAA